MVHTVEWTKSTPWLALAGGLLILVGLANATFGVLGLATDIVRLTTTTSGALLAAGVATSAGGVLIWRGSPAALTTALTVFGLLLIAQFEDATDGSSGHGAAAPRLIVLAILVAVLGFARSRLRNPRRR